MRQGITATTKIRDLRGERRPSGGVAVSLRMLRSIRQSMRVEGYDVSEDVVRQAAEHVLSERGRR